MGQSNPGLPITRYLHAPRGIHAIQLPDNNWHSIMQDGLGSIRSVVDMDGAVAQSIGYTPYGVPDAAYPWAFTGEQRDGTGIQYHRARYYNPTLGIFPSLDPFEGDIGRIMSLNGYSWVEGQVVDATDASGLECNRLRNAMRTGALSRYVYGVSGQEAGSSFGDDLGISGSGCSKYDWAVTILAADFLDCRREYADHSNVALAFEVNFRKFVNGIDLRQTSWNTLGSQCPQALALNPCGNQEDCPLSFLEAVRQCYPIKLPCSGESLEHIMNFAVHPRGVELLPPELGGAVLAASTAVDNLNVLIGGFRVIEGTFHLPTMFLGLDMSLEWLFSPYYAATGEKAGCGWFANVYHHLSTSDEISLSIGLLIGATSWPQTPGDFSVVFSIGGSMGSDAVDLTWSPSTGGLVLFLGKTHSITAWGRNRVAPAFSGFIAIGASTYLGKDLADIPQSAWQGLSQVGDIMSDASKILARI